MNLSICLSPCPFLCPYDWKTHWEEGRIHCEFVLLAPPLIGPCEQLELRCRRNVSNRCRIWRYYSIGCRRHRSRHISVHSTKFLRRKRSFFVNIWFFVSSDGGGTLCKNKNEHNLEEWEKYFRSCQPGETLRKQSHQLHP